MMPLDAPPSAKKGPLLSSCCRRLPGVLTE